MNDSMTADAAAQLNSVVDMTSAVKKINHLGFFYTYLFLLTSFGIGDQGRGGACNLDG